MVTKNVVAERIHSLRDKIAPEDEGKMKLEEILPRRSAAL